MMPILRVLRSPFVCAFAVASAYATPKQTFSVTGQVAVVANGTRPRVYLVADPPLSSFWVEATGAPSCKPGDIVVACGYREPLTNRQFDNIATELTVMGHETLRTAPASGSQVNGGELLCKPVEITGVFGAAVRDDVNDDWNLLTLRTPAGNVAAAVPESELPLKALKGLTDAEVVLRGLVTRFGIWRSFLGYEVMMFGKEGLSVLVPPPSDPFSAGDFDGSESLHRVRASGTVLAVGKRVYVRTDQDDLLPVTPVDCTIQPRSGQRVTAVGFTKPDQRNLQLVEAVIRTGPSSGPRNDTVHEIDLEALYSDDKGNPLANTEYYGNFVRITGLVANSDENIQTYRSLTLACGKRTISIDLTPVAGELENFPLSGSTLSVTGLCIAEFGGNDTYALIPKFKGFTLLPRTPADIQLVSRPPWWTPGRLLYVIAALVLTIIVILVWNRMLQLLSERRGRALAKEEIASARANLKVEERTRLAVELHDSISQTLTGVSFQIETAADLCEKNPSATRRFLETARHLLASCRQELRCCIWDLRSRTFEEKDMTEAIVRMLRQHATGIRITVRFNVPRQILSEMTVNAVLRIVRELAINAIRHGQATQIRIAGEHHGRRISFSVTDDGIGLPETVIPGPDTGHFGLQGIRERLSPFNGELRLSRAKPHGTKVSVTMDDRSPDTEEDERT